MNLFLRRAGAKKTAVFWSKCSRKCPKTACLTCFFLQNLCFWKRRTIWSNPNEFGRPKKKVNNIYEIFWKPNPPPREHPRSAPEKQAGPSIGLWFMVVEEVWQSLPHIITKNPIECLILSANWLMTTWSLMQISSFMGFTGLIFPQKRNQNHLNSNLWMKTAFNNTLLSSPQTQAY